MDQKHFNGKREKYRLNFPDIAPAVRAAREFFHKKEYNNAFDIYEQLYIRAPQYAVPILTEAYQYYQQLPGQDRYTLYQSRFLDFGIRPSDKVLDIGSGHLPFPLATHLGEFAI